MSIILVGLNHNTAPVELREQFYYSEQRLQNALTTLCNPLAASASRLSEGVILSTCNRFEIYGVAADARSGFDLLTEFLAPAQPDHLYHLQDEDVFEHLMRVAAGLDSMILGEPQILGQVADSLTHAQRVSAAGAALSHLFAQAIHAGKRARTETPISRHTTSVSHAAAQLACETVEDVAQARVLLVGAGEMSELAGRALRAHGVAQIGVVNRTFPKAESLAEHFGGCAFGWNQLWDALTWADVVITATSAPHIIVYAEDVARTLPGRADRPLTFIDVAVPRNTDDAVGKLPGVTCHNIDALRATVDANLAQRRAAVSAVEAIIAEELGVFCEWLASRQVVPVIVDLRRKAENIVSAELEHALNRLDGLDAHDQQIVTQLAQRIVNKLLHDPTVFLKAHAGSSDGYEYAHAVRELFALNTPQREVIHE